MVKRTALKQMFVCAYNSQDEEAKSMIQPIVVELLSGVDCSLLTSKEMQSVPFDYIRQVCLLPAMTEAEQSEYGEEAIVSEN